METTESAESAEEVEEDPSMNCLAVELALSRLSWRDLDSCRLTCRLWAEAVDGLRKGRPPYTFALDGDGAPARPPIRHPPCVSLLMLKSPDDELRRQIDDFWNPGTGPRIVLESDHVFCVPAPSAPPKGNYKACGLSIPTIEGVRIDTFEIGDSISSEFISPHPMTRIVPANWIKCILAFPEKNSLWEKWVIYDAASFAASRQPEQPQIAIGGGFVYDIQQGGKKRKTSRRRGTQFVVISVPKIFKIDTHFKAFSKIIRIERLKSELKDYDFDDDAITASLKKILKEISQKISILRHSVGLMFTNIRHNHSNMVKSFSKYFPNTPLLGCATIEEVGITNFASNDVTFVGDRHKFFFTAFSAILVILTWN